MPTRAQNRMLVALGHATQGDPFQGGREAAQMAKSQLGEGPIDLVLVFGPNSDHFQEIIEGVRLVTGEENLIGVPVERIISHNLFAENAFSVLMIRSPETKLTIASGDSEEKGTLSAITNIITQLRHGRGNITQQFETQGYLLFDNSSPSEKVTPAQQLAFEIGLEGWFAGFRTTVPNKKSPIISRDRIVNSGLTAVECLSNRSWAMGEVQIGEFKDNPKVYHEAVKSAARGALNNLRESNPAFAFLIFNFSINDFEPTELQKIIESAETILPGVPLIGFPVDYNYVRTPERTWLHDKDSLTVMVAPE